MPRYTGYNRIYAKRNTNPVDENLFKVKKGSIHPSSSSVSNIPTVARATLQRAQTSPQNLTPQEMRQLQGTMGNRALSRMVAPQTSQMIPARATGPTLQRTPSTVYRRTMPKYVVQRWKWPWRRGETNEQKLARYTRTMDNLATAIDVLRVGHGLVMLPVTVVDLLSNIARPFTGNKVRNKSGGSKKEENRKVFHNVVNGESQLVALMGGHNAYFDIGILKYMPWNIIPWIIGALRRWSDKVQRKKTALYIKMNNIDTNNITKKMD